MEVAIVRRPTDALRACELTYLERRPIAVDQALRQHAGYVDFLLHHGVHVLELPPTPALPDSPFVEDTAVILNEVAVVTRPGTDLRRQEVPTIEKVLARFLTTTPITEPATLDGGDVLVAGSRIFVGRSARSNPEGIAQLGRLSAPLGYSVAGVALSGCLHLKSAVTHIGQDTLLVNPAWVDPAAFSGFEIIPVDPGEPFAANTLTVGSVVVLSASCLRTRDLVQHRGFTTAALDVSEFEKAEAGLTCLSLRIEGLGD